MGYSSEWERARQPTPSEPIRFKEPKIGKWIRKHPFANYDWFKYHIRHEEWFPERKKNHYFIMVSERDGIKPIWVKIKFKYYPKSHILVHHPHVPKRYGKPKFNISFQTEI